MLVINLREGRSYLSLGGKAHENPKLSRDCTRQPIGICRLYEPDRQNGSTADRRNSRVQRFELWIRPSFQRKRCRQLHTRLRKSRLRCARALNAGGSRELGTARLATERLAGELPAERDHLDFTVTFGIVVGRFERLQTLRRIAVRAAPPDVGYKV